MARPPGQGDLERVTRHLGHLSSPGEKGRQKEVSVLVSSPRFSSSVLLFLVAGSFSGGGIVGSDESTLGSNTLMMPQEAIAS
jgi:hypothetical protein